MLTSQVVYSVSYEICHLEPTTWEVLQSLWWSIKWDGSSWCRVRLSRMRSLVGNALCKTSLLPSFPTNCQDLNSPSGREMSSGTLIHYWDSKVLKLPQSNEIPFSDCQTRKWMICDSEVSLSVNHGWLFTAFNPYKSLWNEEEKWYMWHGRRGNRLHVSTLGCWDSSEFLRGSTCM